VRFTGPIGGQYPCRTRISKRELRGLIFLLSKMLRAVREVLEDKRKKKKTMNTHLRELLKLGEGVQTRGGEGQFDSSREVGRNAQRGGREKRKEKPASYR